MPSLSRDLEQTLHRAVKIAADAQHEFATVEHLLLALTNDRSAVSVLSACNVDIGALQAAIEKYLNDEIAVVPQKNEEDPKIAANFQRTVQRAVLHVQNSGREEVEGANVLVALFTERETHAVYFLQEQGMTRLDAVSYVTHGISKPPIVQRQSQTSSRIQVDSLARDVSSSGRGSPRFRAVKGRVRYYPAKPAREFVERKAVVTERCAEARALCGRRANEQIQLKKLIERYSDALHTLTRSRGSYRLLFAGLEIESLIKIKALSPYDPDRNLPIDADLLHAVESLIIAHAGLMVLFPDIRETTDELDRYRQSSEAVDALRNRVLEPVLASLVNSRDLLDRDTLEITKEISEVGEIGDDELPLSKREAAVKHSWLRGLLSAIGIYVAEKIRGSVARAGEVAIKDAVLFALKNPENLLAAIMRFLSAARDVLAALGSALSSSFGWLTSLLRMLGLM